MFDADYEYITNTGPKVILQTNKNAKNFKLVSLNLDNLETAWQDFLPEHEKVEAESFKYALFKVLKQ